MAQEKTGTIFKVSFSEIAEPDKFFVTKTPLDKKADINLLYRRMSGIAERVCTYLAQTFGYKARIPTMEVQDGSIVAQRVFGSTLDEMTDLELSSLPNSVLREICSYIHCADRLDLGHNGAYDFLDIWGYNKDNPNPISRVMRAFDVRHSTNLMIGYVMNRNRDNGWEPSEEGVWLVDPDSYLQSTTNVISRYGIQIAKPTVVEFFTERFRDKYVRTMQS